MQHGTQQALTTEKKPAELVELRLRAIHFTREDSSLRLSGRIAVIAQYLSWSLVSNYYQLYGFLWQQRIMQPGPHISLTAVRLTGHGASIHIVIQQPKTPRFPEHFKFVRFLKQGRCEVNSPTLQIVILSWFCLIFLGPKILQDFVSMSFIVWIRTMEMTSEGIGFSKTVLNQRPVVSNSKQRSEQAWWRWWALQLKMFRQIRSDESFRLPWVQSKVLFLGFNVATWRGCILAI